MPNPKFSFAIAAGSGRPAPITQKGAKVLIRQGVRIAVPEATDASARELFVDMFKFADIRPVNLSCQVGIWLYGIRVYNKWRILAQTSRQPKPGFEYQLGSKKFPSFEALEDHCYPTCCEYQPGHHT